MVIIARLQDLQMEVHSSAVGYRIEKFAEAEHLTAHANSIKVRFDGKD